MIDKNQHLHHVERISRAIMFKNEESECRACGAKIHFGYIEKTHKFVPLDKKAPTYEIIQTDIGPVAVRSEAYVSHFATCPKADRFSKKKKKPQMEMGI